MPKLTYDEPHMFDLYLECRGKIGALQRHPRTHVKAYNTLLRLEREHKWAERGHDILARVAGVQDSDRATEITKYKVRELEALKRLKKEVGDLIFPEVDKDGNKFYKIDMKNIKFHELVRAWTKITDQELTLMGENKMILEIRHVVEEKMTLVMKLVFASVQSVVDEGVITEEGCKRLFDVCREKVTAEALGLVSGGGGADS